MSGSHPFLDIHNILDLPWASLLSVLLKEILGFVVALEVTPEML
jgi:hypothetical protein